MLFSSDQGIVAFHDSDLGAVLILSPACSSACIFLNKYLLTYLAACLLSCFSRVQLFVTLWTVPARLLCPWDSPGKKIGVGCHALLQGIFLTQGSNPSLLPLLQWQVLYHWCHLGSPILAASALSCGTQITVGGTGSIALRHVES